jgi:hypothetical protein
MTTKAKEIVLEALGDAKADLDEVVIDYIIGKFNIIKLIVITIHKAIFTILEIGS